MAYRKSPAPQIDADESVLFRRAGLAEDLSPPATSYNPMMFADEAHLPSAAPLAAVVEAGETPTVLLACGCAGCLKGYKGTDGFPWDGVGDDKDTVPVQPVLLTTDLHPNDATTTTTLTVDGAHVVATIDTIGDEDWFRVELEAGQTYDISMFLVVGGPSLVPLADAYIELYDAAGELVLTADGGGPNTPQGLDAILTYTVEEGGTYYINARAYDQAAENGTTGDFVGDYEIFVTTVDEADPNAYVPFYSPDSPLHSIDWGTQFTRTSRNPDGDSGTRSDNGVPEGGAPIVNNTYGIEGKNVITFYFAKTGDVFVDEDPTNPGLTTTIIAQGMQQWEKDAFHAAFDLYENVADIVYIEVQDRAEADIKIITYEGTPGAGASLLGRMSPPGTNNAGQMEINTGDVRWTEEGVKPGGFYFPTLLHELGHGHGMAHPHDNGGRSSIMRGSDDGSAIGGATAEFDLSQQVFTIMSYNDGWSTSPYGQPRSGGITGLEVDHYGWMGTLAALDIAVLQDKYGVNEEFATGANIYTLKNVNAAGTYYATIWDGGGTDEIRYTGSGDANIDLRPATLQYEYGGGGWVSYVDGIHGGYTIANGVVIENATGGSGADTLTGNDAANILRGNAGDDIIVGGAGNDRLEGGAGADEINGGEGNDTLTGGDDNDVLTDAAGTRDQLYGQNGDDTLIIQREAGSTGTFVLEGGAGDDRFVLQALGGLTIARGGDGADRFEASGAATVVTGAGVDLVQLAADFASGAVVTVDDFQAGAGGDRIDMAAFMAAHFTGWDGTSSPMASGHVRFNADATGTLVQVDLDGGGNSWTTVIKLKGVSPGSLVSENVGFVIAGGGPNGITGTAGPDTLNGSPGADIILGLEGNDTLKGHAGDDQLLGDGGRDKLYGLDGNDQLFGGDDLDQLLGGAGDDALFGEGGDDVLIGGLGKDTLTGGAGKDIFSYSLVAESAAGAADRILDFNASQGDKLSVKAVDADIHTAGDQAFAFVAAFTGAAAQAVRAYDAGANLTTLSFDVDGDAVADMVIELNGAVTSGWIL